MDAGKVPAGSAEYRQAQHDPVRESAWCEVPICGDDRRLRLGRAEQRRLFRRWPAPRFLLEKGALVRSPLWTTAFYFHVVGASTCLLVGLPLMFPYFTRRHPAWHRRLGYVYINTVLWLAAPAGLILAATAKGGWWGTIGFAFAGAWWWQTTWTGYRTILRRDLPAHIRAMIRSHTLALSAPSFRVSQALLYALGLDDEPTTSSRSG